ncbi:hypothetical protein MXAN_1920 [Myxococcus xanthus DK 1622]|uniref:POTRA domain-containing protein n=1 Tax=Myxococcus xanthus (strain DK1622) TaxID=246197 RepID=Q1DB09_MYXXD|nr:MULTISPECIES: hypothetical protein [Myxococcus]ABF86047.1 hypothetical protein MXAN_1920 [Myxococcus xanthus DK 1622]NOJ56797.1 hypothetical protein [Myxococcus xanthus]QPM81505.1 hypothetical protein I5Q59_09550 [Myxococcus xanthus]QVW70755.1 hypothetical protein JTM82_14910 [Myxococcus xanthus DZ2]QZZ49666.1 hypothetical protein MyxoNM_10660 [Myxococcus xanthus]
MRSAFALIVLLAAAPVLAQDASQASSSSSGATSPKKAPRKVIRLEAITVEGRIQKPQAMYILQRSNLSFDDLSRTESFVPKVEKSVEQEPF